MKKIFMNRSVDLISTIRQQLYYINNTFHYDIKNICDPNNIFYISQITVNGINKNINYQSTSGKGLSLNECLASNYGELIERYAWYEFRNKISRIDNLKIEGLNLVNNKIDIFDSKNILEYEGRGDYIASGNNFFEAIYHVITEAYEYGLLNNYYPYIPIKYTILDTESIYPELPEYIHNSYSILLRQDTRLPLYDITAFKMPLEKDNKFMPISIVNNNGNIKLQSVIKHFSSSVGDIFDEDPWPSFSGSRAGLSLEKTIKLAIAEQVQEHYLLKLNGYVDYDIEYTDKDLKRYDTIYTRKSALEFKNNETDSIEDDIQIITKALNKIGFGMWIIDITPPNCPMKVVKLITDYSIGKDNPHSERVLNNFFYIGEKNEF